MQAYKNRNVSYLKIFLFFCSKNNKNSFIKILQTIIAGLLGIQSKKNMQADFDNFSQGRFGYYILAGVITVVIIIITIYSLVKYII